MSVADYWFEPWPHPLPPIVVTIAERLNGRELALCEHVGEPATYTARRLFWFARFPDELRCALCVAPLAGALRQARSMAPQHVDSLNRCDHCKSTHTPSHRKSVRAGNVLMVIELCEPCLNSEGAPSGEAPAEEPDRRDDKNGIRYGQG